jgi:hypothetical protein
LIAAPRYDFVVQFCWQVPPPNTMVELTQLYSSAAVAGNPVPAAAPGEPIEPAGDEPAADDADDAEPAMEGDETEEGGPDAPDQAAAKANEEK